MDLGNALVKASQQPTSFQFLYPLDLSIKVCSLASTGAAHASSWACLKRVSSAKPLGPTPCSSCV